MGETGAAGPGALVPADGPEVGPGPGPPVAPMGPGPLGLKPGGVRADIGRMWRTFNELRAAERLESGTEPARPSEAMTQATRLPDSITFNGVRYVPDDGSAARRAAS